jgi:tetrapyrrole methylase family protein/MazG family protein
MARINEFEKLVEIVEKLRGENGCPWDKEQTIESLKSDVVGEVEELRQAIENKGYENLKEEIGDVIWASVLLAQVAKDDGLFDIDEVLKAVNEKMVGRHPHVFGGAKAANGEEATRLFKEAKANEKKQGSRR